MIKFKTSLILLAALSSAVAAQDSGEYTEFAGATGSINWTKGRVIAEGYGVAPANKNKKVAPLLACRAATADAQRNLLETTQGVRINSTTNVSNFVATNDEVKTSVEGTVKGAMVTSREPSDDGSCKIVLELVLAGKVSNSIYSAEDAQSDQVMWRTKAKDFWSNISFFPKAFASTVDVTADWQKQLKSIDERLTKLEQKLSADMPAPTKPKASEELTPTGLVVDARGSNFIPSLSPKVRKLRGHVVYPVKQHKAGIINSGRLVSLFARNVEFALNHPIVGDRPLLVKALRTWGDTRSEIVLGSESATKVESLGNSDFFTDAGVIIVLD